MPDLDGAEGNGGRFPWGGAGPFREPDAEVELAGHAGDEGGVFADEFSIDPVLGREAGVERVFVLAELLERGAPVFLVGDGFVLNPVKPLCFCDMFVFHFGKGDEAGAPVGGVGVVFPISCSEGGEGHGVVFFIEEGVVHRLVIFAVFSELREIEFRPVEGIAGSPFLKEGIIEGVARMELVWFVGLDFDRTVSIGPYGGHDAFRLRIFLRTHFHDDLETTGGEVLLGDDDTADPCFLFPLTGDRAIVEIPVGGAF